MPRGASTVRSFDEPFIGVEPDVGGSEEYRHHVGDGRVVHEPLKFGRHLGVANEFDELILGAVIEEVLLLAAVTHDTVEAELEKQ